MKLLLEYIDIANTQWPQIQKVLIKVATCKSAPPPPQPRLHYRGHSISVANAFPRTVGTGEVHCQSFIVNVFFLEMISLSSHVGAVDVGRIKFYQIFTLVTECSIIRSESI